ncbi:cell division protein FtsL [Terrarubrum flagellatum]|uniref:cell division protein FtsL n=1 Tax=Terrirubrum flagellatum TaxID=2895980 RepID=UPI00314522EE
MILRLFHVAAIGALLSSALYAYSIKYDTTLRSEQLVKLKHKVQREKDAIAILRAEWQLLNRPERVQELAKQFPDLQQLQSHQIGTIAELPMKSDKGDELGKKLDLLGLAAPTATPRDMTGSITAPKPGAGRTPTAR